MGTNVKHIELLIEEEATPGALQAVEEAASELPVTASVIPAYVRRGVGEWPWIVIIGSYPLLRFIDGFLEAAGADGYTAFKTWIERLGKVRDESTGREGTIMFHDPSSGIMVYLDPHLPEDAYRALNWLDLSSFESGPIRYHVESDEWLNVFEWKIRSRE